MSKRSGFYPCPTADTAGSRVVSQAGGLLLTETVRAVGLDRALSAALGPWRARNAVHDPAKILLDLAVALAVGGDCLADIAALRGKPGVYGSVASDPTASRMIDRLAADPAAALRAIHAARAAARARAWVLAGEHAPDHGIDAGRPLVIDVDATLVIAHSDKEGAAPTFKRGFGHHPLWAFVDHGPDGTGEPLAVLVRPGNAGSNTAADHISVLREALRQLPGHRRGTRPGRKVLVRADAAGCTHELLDWLPREQFGPWQTAWKRHRRYAGDDTFDLVLAALLAQADADGKIEWTVSVDATINRAHQHATNTTRPDQDTGGTVELHETAGGVRAQPARRGA